MKKQTLVLACLAAGLLGASHEAQAQGLFGGRARSGRVFVGPGGPVNLTPGMGYPTSYSSYYSGGSAAPSTSPVAPYSYYAAAPGQPARTYVGPEQVYPFYGKPYGSVGARWSWDAMSPGYSYGRMPLYYAPPLGR